MPRPLQIFRAGRHTSMAGTTLDFSHDDVADLAASYDPDISEAPLVKGHPALDKPAHGWVERLALRPDDIVLAHPTRVDPSFAEDVRTGRWRYISSSIYLPDSDGNPRPGHYYLKHVGLLGAARPAVKGLAPAELAQFKEHEADGVVSFAIDAGSATSFAVDSSSRAGLGILASLVRSLREHLLVDKGEETADKVVPSFIADELRRLSEERDPEPDAAAVPGYTEPNPDGGKTMPGKTMPTPNQPDPKAAADFAQQQADLKAEQDKLAADRKAFDAERAAAEKQRNADRLAAIESYADGLIEDGRLLPKHKPGIVAALERLETAEPVSFAEGETTPAAKALRDVLDDLPKAIDFSEKTPDDEPLINERNRVNGQNVDPDREKLNRMAQAYKAKHEGCTFEQAVLAVTEQQAAN